MILQKHILLFFLGRDTLEQSPLTKKITKYNSNSIAEDQPVLSKEARGHSQNEQHPGKDIPVITGPKARAASLDDEILSKNAAPQRPGLKRRPFSAGVGLAEFAKQSEELKGRKLGRSENLLAHDENSFIDSECSKVEETRSRKTSPEILVTYCHGTTSRNGEKHVVITSFSAEQSGEVSLEEGEEVDVLQKELSGWWYVKNDFCEGWAPSAFLAPVGSRPPSSQTPDRQQVLDSQEKMLKTCPKESIHQGKEKVCLLFS